MSSIGSASLGGDVALRLSGVTKVYESNLPRLGRWRAHPYRSADGSDAVVAIEDVDLVVPKGTSVALIGPNGAGKSTVLRMVAGITHPTRGRVVVNGTVRSLIELGVGFHPDLTGWQNLRCGARLLGLRRDDVTEMEGQIAAFAGLGTAMDAPLRTFSSGMAARLGFAVATSVPCDILAVDEILAVGDQEFRDRCFERIRAMLDSGTTLLFVTHEMVMVPRICERAVHFRAGHIVDDGAAADVVHRYLGGSPARFRQMDEPPARWRSFANVVPRQAPREPVTFEAEIELQKTVRDLEVTVEFTLPVIGEELVFASSTSTLIGRLLPGRHRLRGTSRPFPATSGQCRAIATLLTARGIEVMDIARHDFTLEGPWTDSMPRLATLPSWSIEPNQVGTDARLSGPPPEIDVPHALAELTSVWKTFTGTGSGADLVRRRRMQGHRWVTALRGVGLQVGRGASLGLIGGNGAGKSTALGVIAGTVFPDLGIVRVDGRVVPLLGLGLGFHPELTGRQNARLSAALLGMSRRDVASRLPDIEALSELGDDFERPVRTYSSGMEARLGLAIGLLSDPDVLLIDEALVVGDEAFRRRATTKVNDIRRDGVAVVFVSHELESVAEVCEHVVQLSQGEVVDAGPAAAVLERYSPDSRGGHAILRFHGLEIRGLRAVRQFVPTGDAVEFTGEVRVVDPSCTAWIELRYDFMASDSPATDNSDALQRTFLRAVVEPAGRALASAGRYGFRGSVPDNDFCGALWLILAVVDLDEEGGETIVSQAWCAVTVGRPTPQITIPLDIEWTVESP